MVIGGLEIDCFFFEDMIELIVDECGIDLVFVILFVVFVMSLVGMV